MLHESLTNAAKRRPPPTYRSVILVSTSVFMGYAALVTLQHRLKDVHDNNSEKAHLPSHSTEFKHASTLNYVGNLVFRLAHNFVFFFLSPRQRVHLALGCMAASMGCLAFAMCKGGSPWIGWVFISYFLGGVAIGTFESNLLSCITPLGHGSKKWVIFGMPLPQSDLGGRLLLLQARVPLVALYLAVLVSCVVSMILFAVAIPVALPANVGTISAASSSSDPISVAPISRGQVDEAVAAALDVPTSDADPTRLPRLCDRSERTLPASWVISARPAPGFRASSRTRSRSWWICTASASSPRSCSTFSTILTPESQVALFGPNTKTLVPHDAYFAVYNWCDVQLSPARSRPEPPHVLIWMHAHAAATTCFLTCPYIPRSRSSVCPRSFAFFGDTLSRQLVYRASRLHHPSGSSSSPCSAPSFACSSCPSLRP